MRQYGHVGWLDLITRRWWCGVWRGAYIKGCAYVHAGIYIEGCLHYGVIGMKGLRRYTYREDTLSGCIHSGGEYIRLDGLSYVEFYKLVVHFYDYLISPLNDQFLHSPFTRHQVVDKQGTLLVSPVATDGPHFVTTKSTLNQHIISESYCIYSPSEFTQKLRCKLK